MTTFAWPSTLTPQSVGWTLQKAGVSFRSPFAGSVESVGFPGEYWKVSVTLPPRQLQNGGEGEAFAARLAGGVDRVQVPYWPRLVPKGTLRGYALSVAAVRGDLTLSVGCPSGVTLKAGDMIGVGGQLFQAFQDCASDGSTLLVPLVNHVRAAIASSTALVWNAPTVLCCVPSMSSGRAYEPRVATALPIELEEVPV